MPDQCGMLENKNGHGFELLKNIKTACTIFGHFFPLVFSCSTVMTRQAAMTNRVSLFYDIYG